MKVSTGSPKETSTPPVTALSMRHRTHHPDPRIPSFRNENEAAMPGRLRRTKSWQDREDLSPLAQITVLEHGGHARPIITRGGKHLRSRMGSRKTGLQQIGEGRAHRDLIMLNEVHPEVIDYQAHPFKIEFQLSGIRQVYYPDHVRLLRDGTIELIEVKRTPADLSDADYRAKLGGVAEIARRVGWNFRILYQCDIDGPPARKDNVEAIYMHRFMRLTRAEQLEISRFTASGRDVAWAELRTLVCPDDCRRGEAVLRSCIALGQIAVDLDAPITNTSIITACKPAPPLRGFRI